MTGPRNPIVARFHNLPIRSAAYTYRSSAEEIKTYPPSPGNLNPHVDQRPDS